MHGSETERAASFATLLTRKQLSAIHHKDLTKTNHAVENLVCLCFDCHQLVHGLLRSRAPHSVLPWIEANCPEARERARCQREPWVAEMSSPVVAAVDPPSVVVTANTESEVVAVSDVVNVALGGCRNLEGQHRNGRAERNTGVACSIENLEPSDRSVQVEDL